MRVANPRGEASLRGPKGGFWPDDFSKKIVPWVAYLFDIMSDIMSDGIGEAWRRND